MCFIFYNFLYFLKNTNISLNLIYLYIIKYLKLYPVGIKYIIVTNY